jgi:hypothetical protein
MPDVVAAEPVETPTQTSQVTGGSTAPETPTPETPSWAFREAVKGLGIEGEWKDDAEAFNDFKGRLSQTLSQQQQEIQALRQYEAYYRAQQAQAAQAAQQQAQAPQKASSNDWWGAPEWDDSLTEGFAVDPKTGQIARDGYGNPLVKPGYDPSLAHKYESYQKFRQQAAEKLLRNPVEAIKPGLEPVIQQIVQKAVQEAVGMYGATDAARRYVESKRDVFVAKDAQGNPVLGQDGRPMFSVEGRVFAQAAEQAASLGLDPDAQRYYAEQAMELYSLRQQVKAKGH